MEYGADPSMSDNDGYTAVHLAAKEGHNGVLEKLLSTGELLFFVSNSVLIPTLARAFPFMTFLHQSGAGFSKVS